MRNVYGLMGLYIHKNKGKKSHSKQNTQKTTKTKNSPKPKHITAH